MNNKRWSAYNSNTKPDGPKLTESPELEELLARHPGAAHYFKDGVYNIRLVTCSVDNPVNPIDVTKTIAITEIDEQGNMTDGMGPEYTTEALIELLMTHNTEQGVLMTSSQATAVYNVLKPEVIEEGMV